MDEQTLVAVLGRLGVARPAPDLEGLRAVYAAWCGAIPFDNTLKLIHTARRRPGPLPGSTADDFFAAWLEHGTGGTCWAGNGALHDLFDALGFEVERAIATMMPTPEVRSPNHGTVVATLEGERWIVDASILSGEPIRITEPGEPAAGPLPRLEWLGDRPAVVWRILTAPDGFPCRIERIGADTAEWDVLHQRTGAWSPFNYQLNARLLRDGTSLGFASEQRFTIADDGSLTATPCGRDARTRFLVEEIGIAESIARQLPDDQPVPPRPEGR